jgi:8-oxo-dGTP pyrophosphatase MutT (NUDIX family)
MPRSKNVTDSLYLSNLMKKLAESKKRTYSGVASVSIILSEAQDGINIFLVKRASRDNDPWSSQMAFPGGRKSQIDSDLFDTVIRETLEETGIGLKQCSFLGVLEPVNSTLIPELNVLPFVFHCEEKPEIMLNEEVVSSFWIPLEELSKSYCRTRIGSLIVQGYAVKGEVVWGLTFRMLEKLFELIGISPEH